MPRPELKSGSLGLDENLNKKVNPFLSDDGFYHCSGFHLDEALSISKWKGFRRFNYSELLENGIPATFTGIFDYAKSDMTRQQITTTTKGVYLYNSPIGNAWNALSLAGCGGNRTGSQNDLFDGMIYNDILYLGNGVDSNIKYDGIHVPWNMGITGPSAAECSAWAVGVGAAGVLTGVYQYKVTYYNSTLGHESNPSDDNTSARSVSVTLTAQKGDLSGIPISGDPQVNKRKLYRTTAGGGVWLYVATINDNTTTTYIDNSPDTQLGVAIDQFGNGVPPKFAFIRYWKGSTFIVPKNSSTIYFSKAGNPNAFDSNDYRELGKNDGNVITGMALINDTLVIYKNNSIWNGIGDDRFTFGFVKQPPTIGSICNKGILAVPGNGLHYFPSQDGYYIYNGISTIATGLGLQKDYQALNPSRLNVISGVPYKNRKELLWLASSSDSDKSDIIIWFDYLQNKWGTRNISNTKANVISTMRGNDNRDHFYIGGYDGHVYEGDLGGSDNGHDISCDVIDRAHPKNDISSETIKCFTHIFVWFEPIVGSTVEVSYAIDNPEGTYIVLGNIDASIASGQNHLHFKALGRRIYPRFKESSNLQGLVLRGWRLYYRNMGRHNAP